MLGLHEKHMLIFQKHGDSVQGTTSIVLFVVSIGVRIQATTTEVTSNITYRYKQNNGTGSKSLLWNQFINSVWNKEDFIIALFPLLMNLTSEHSNVALK